LPDLYQPDLASSTSILRAMIRTSCGRPRSESRSVAELGLSSWIKTSGSKGFHIVVRSMAPRSSDTVWRFAHGVAAILVKRRRRT